MRTLIVFGNCQARLISDLIAHDPAIAGSYRVLFVRSYLEPGRQEALPTPEDYAACSILLEQIDVTPIRNREPFSPDCAIVKFPSIDSNLLWPLHARNPYHAREAVDPGDRRFPYGDRILDRCLDEGMSVDDTLAYYRSQWDAYAPNLTRVAELERARIEKRESGSDVRISDIALDPLPVKPVFSSPNHPLPEVIRALASRIAAASARYDPAFAQVDIESTASAQRDLAQYTCAMELPIHPRVAEGLGLRWFDSAKLYEQVDGSYRTHDEYLAELVAYSLRKRKENRNFVVAEPAGRVGCLREVRGPIAAVGRTSGIYFDSFMSGNASFEAEAQESIRAIVVRGFVPAYHTSSVTLQIAVGSRRSEIADVAPGSMFELECDVDIAAGSRARVDVGCSSWFNLLERGESEDNRDLSALLLSVEGRV